MGYGWNADRMDAAAGTVQGGGIMAGVYVRGVKKPYGCTFCPWYRTFCSFCTAANKNVSVLEMKGPDWCPLVEVPDHGDLIDRDVLMKYKASAYDIDDHELYAVGTGTILRMPAVIPSDNGEKEET